MVPVMLMSEGDVVKGSRRHGFLLRWRSIVLGVLTACAVAPAFPQSPGPREVVESRLSSTGASGITGDYCKVAPGYDRASVTLRELPNGNLNFGVEFWTSGHSCGFNETAKRVKPGRWRFFEPASKENAEMGCGVTIAHAGKQVTMRVERDAPCRAYCGARAMMPEVITLNTAKRKPLSSGQQSGC